MLDAYHSTADLQPLSRPQCQCCSYPRLLSACPPVVAVWLSVCC